MTQFLTLFTINISHAYYDAGCRDFDFVFPSDTAHQLRRGKLLAKKNSNALNILFEAGNSGDALIPFAGKTIRIGLKLMNPFFSNFTDLTFMTGRPALFCGNYEDPAALDTPAGTMLIGRVFSHPIETMERPLTAIVKDAGGQTLKHDVITASDNLSAISVNLTGRDAGAYEVEEVYSGGARTTSYYSDAELRQQGVFGVMEITIDGDFYSSPPAFNITFDAKREILKYYIVTRDFTSPELTKLSIVDNGHTEDGPECKFYESEAGGIYRGGYFSGIAWRQRHQSGAVQVQ